jgi:hypothetical protein
MSNDKLLYFFLGGIFWVSLTGMLHYSRNLETRNAYQQETIDNQRLWLEHEKGDEW